MIKTTDKWKRNQKEQITSEAFLEIVHKITNPTLAPAKAKEKNNDIMYFSNMYALVDEFEYDIAPYGTLEKNFWLLNGEKETLFGNGTKCSGFTSKSICDKDGYFWKLPAEGKPVIENPTISILFEENVPLLPGCTIVWSDMEGEYPAKFEITVSDTSIKDKEPIMLYSTPKEGNGKNEFILESAEMVNFNRIDIKIKKWNRSFRRARIGKIILGIYKVYEKDDLMGFSCSESLDPVSANLPKYSIQFSVDNLDDKNGLFQYMNEWQEIRTRYGYNTSDGYTEWIPGGV